MGTRVSASVSPSLHQIPTVVDAPALGETFLLIKVLTMSDLIDLD